MVQKSLLAHETVFADAPANDIAAPKDYFIERDGQVFAGSHVLADLWGAENLDNQELIETALREAIDVCGATLLNIHLHRFTEGGGISGVAVLAESHISVHTWPERGFAAFDVFMCGSCDPEEALPVLRRYFHPSEMKTSLERRGTVE
jgi:S-adenosylmethionine decarboxylase